MAYEQAPLNRLFGLREEGDPLRDGWGMGVVEGGGYVIGAGDAAGEGEAGGGKAYNFYKHDVSGRGCGIPVGSGHPIGCGEG